MPRSTLGLSLAILVSAGISCNGDEIAGPTGSPEAQGLASAAGRLSFLHVSVGSGSHTCGVTTANRLYCWGDNSFGQLGNGTHERRSTPAPVLTGLLFRTVAAGAEHTCALTLDQRAFCWGHPFRIGIHAVVSSHPPDRLRPVAVSGGLHFIHLVSGTFHSCGLTTSRQVYCWGQNQLGDGTGNYHYSPVLVAGGRTYRDVAVGAAHTCAIASTYRMFCWGFNNMGQLGDGTTRSRLVPTAVAGTITFQDVALGVEHSCAVGRDKRAYCWGQNEGGQLGDGSTMSRLTPRAVSGGISFERIRVGGTEISCGETTDHRAYCWGDNGGGFLILGTNDPALVPVVVAKGFTFTEMKVSDHWCGRTGRGVLYCWGGNHAGQVGDGTTITRYVPTPVAGTL
jgi:alpha-tubulin suppressor-like RCC1 family protein